MRLRLLSLAVIASATHAFAGVEIDLDALGASLGGWNAHKGKAAEYELSEAGYRTYQPEVSPSPDGGIFVSMRIDHRRGFMASDDHASLELSFAADGALVSAQSSLALQGHTISSDLIRGGASATTSVAAPEISRAVKVGTDLVADLSSKLLREKIVEPGRVSFPAAIRHNYNLLYQAVRVRQNPAAPAVPLGSDVPAPAASNPPATSPSSVPPPSGLTPPSAAPVTQPGSAGAPQPAAAPTAPQPATTKKEIPLPEVKPYNPGGAPATPIPPKKEQSLILKYGDDVVKIARDVVEHETR
jgi:hypothetical protein